MTGHCFAVEVLEKLRNNSHLSKHKHLEQSKLTRSLHSIFGVAVITINIVLGSKLLTHQGGAEDGLGVAITLAFFAALLGSIQTFFNFEKKTSDNRSVGNEYLGVARECERLLAAHFDGVINLKELSESIVKINQRYAQVNSRSEKLHVLGYCYRRASKTQNEKNQKDTMAAKFGRERTCKECPPAKLADCNNRPPQDNNGG